MKTSTADTQALLGLIIRGMVSDRDAVRIVALPGPGMKTTFQVRVGGTEIGKLIGKQGRVARSLRTILMCIGRQQGTEFALDLDNQIEQAGSS